MHPPVFSRSRWRPRVAVAAGLTILIGASGVPALAAPAAATPATPATSKLIGEAQALAEAQRSGSTVPVTAATTPTETLTAHPDGTLSLTQAVQPVRKLVDGGWKDLDATLTVAADGTIVPAVALGGLRLSGGGNGPLATMAGGGRLLGLTAPFPLPKPVLAGDTATYGAVLPGVDLRVTADTQGGFSEVFVIADAKAAANPLLKTLTFGTTVKGLALRSDAAGNIAATDATGQTVVTAAAPRMWDSATATPPTVTAQRSGLRVDAASGQRAVSTERAPGRGAHLARLGVAVSGKSLSLTPAQSLLTGSAVKWPVYVDPTFTWLAVGSAVSGYAVVSKNYPSTNYWKDSPSSGDDMQSGHDPDGGDVRRTLLNFTIDTTKLSGATINDATLNITETWSYNCTASLVDLYAPAKDLTSSTANWNSWSDTSTYGSRVDQVSAAHGWSSDCKAAGVPFDIAGAIRSDVSAGNKTQTFVIKANSESADSGWKRWDKTTPKITIHYDHAPSKPTGLKTSPTTSCTGSTIGDTAVKLYATVSDPDGGTVGETFKIWKTSNSAVTKSSDPDALYAASGSSAVPYTVDEAWFKAAAAGVPTSFSWNVQITDYKYSSAASSTCSFTWDPTRQGPPDLAGPDSATIGLPVSVGVTFTKQHTTDTVPASYQYQLNGGPFSSVTADTTGAATITVTPRRFTNILTVTSVSSGSNIGDTAALTFTALPAATASDGDLTGDGAADLLTVGAANNVPSGLWMAPGTGNPNPGLNVLSTNVGAVGNGTQGDNSPADFDGAQAITGHFTGSGLQDILYYYPSGANAGGGGVLNGNGDGTPIYADQSGNQHTISAGSLSDWNGDNPLTLANAGNADGNVYPDLVGILGDATNGYSLQYYPNQGGLLNYGFPVQLSVPAPDNTMNWNSWSITTARHTDGTTDMFLWNRSTGALHLWSDLNFDVNNSTFSYAGDTVLADGVSTVFLQSATAAFQSADINRDGNLDVWTVGAGGAVTAWLVTNVVVGGTGTITAQPALTMNTSAHTWLLNNGEDGTAVGAAQALDSVGTLHGTGGGGVKWNSGDLYDPDADFDGSTGVITTAKAVTTTGDFSVSLWAKPTAYSGNIVSQNGTAGVGFKIWPSSDTTWDFGMQQSNAAYSSASQYDIAKSATGTAKLNVWYHIVATYSASTKTMSLYLNDRLAGTATHTPSWSADDTFKIGTMRTSASGYGYFFKGQVALVQLWNTVIDPQPEPQRGLWDRTRDTNGVWANNGLLVDKNTANINTASAAMPDGSMWVFNMIPNSGIWARQRSAKGYWAANATRIDTNGTITAIAAAATPDGTLHVICLVPGSGIYYRTRSPAGVWASSSTQVDTNGSISAISLASLPDGTVMYQDVVPNSGIWIRTRSAAGVWAAGATKIDTTATISDIAAAGLPDGTMHVFSVVPGAGIYERTRSSAGTWATSTSHVDLNGGVTQVSAAGAADGTLHFTSVLPNYGMWHFTRTAAGTWQPAIKMEDNLAIVDAYTVILTDGTIHVGYVPDVS
jgi:hypothetical protein